MSLKLTPKLRHVAERCIWYEAPEIAILDIPRFMAQVLNFGSESDICEVKSQLNEWQFIAAIDQAPAGIYSPRSWAYWNLMIGRYDPPPLPERRLA